MQHPKSTHKLILSRLLYFVLVLNFLFSTSQTNTELIRLAKNDSAHINQLFKRVRELRKENIDSAISLSQTSIQIAQKHNHYSMLAKIYQNHGNLYDRMNITDSAIAYYKKAEKKYLELNDLKNAGDCIFNQGISFKKKRKFELSKGCLEKSLSICEQLKDTVGVAVCFSSLGNLYFDFSNYPKALEHYLKSLQIREQLNEQEGLLGLYNNIGNIFKEQNNSEKALFYYHKALTIAKAKNDSLKISYALNNIGVIYMNLKNYPEALNFYNQALDLRYKLLDSIGIASILTNIGSIQRFKQNYDTALIYYKNALNVIKNQNSPGISANCYINIGLVNSIIGKHKEALHYGQLTVDIGKGMDDINTEMWGHKILSEANASLGNFQDAYKHQLTYKILNDSIYNLYNSKELQDLNTNYEVEKKELELKLESEAKMAVLNEQKTRQKFVIYAIGFILLLVVLFTFLIYKRFVLTKKQSLIIEKQKNEVEIHRKEIVDSIQYAKRIQTALLSNKEFIQEYFPNSFLFFEPKDIVSGDFYWSAENNDTFFIAVCDCTGHGVPGAFMSILNIGFLNEAVKEKNISDPAEILNFVRIRLISSIGSEDQKDGMDGILLTYNKKTKQIKYAAANNQPILINNSTILVLEKDRMPVGKGELNNSFTSREIVYQSGAFLYLYTDGFADQFGGPKGKKYKYKTLNNFLCNISHETPDNQALKLTDELKSWKGLMEQVDDICIVGIRL